MTDRGMSSPEGSPACPFVAFEDDRDERADRPDHRHRCFAESEPAERAFAHQEAYCLSSAFPVCPTFQDWARREAAHARASAEAAAGASATAAAGTSLAAASAEDASGAGASSEGALTSAAEPDDDDRDREDLWGSPRDKIPTDEEPRRNPPRDWAAPPPWAGGAGGTGAAGRRGRAEPDVAAEFLAARSEEGRGLAGSAADRLAGGGGLERDAGGPPSAGPRSTIPDSPSAPPDPDLAGLVGRAGGAEDDAAAPRPPTRPGRRPAVSSTRDRNRDRDRDRDRERVVPTADRSVPHDGPSWERQRRFEAYPTIKTRAGLSGIPPLPRIAVLAGALVLGAVALFFLPALLGVGGRDGPGAASPSPTAVAATATLAPTPIPAPTPQVYVIKRGDTLLRIARDFGLTLEQLMAANKDTIKDPNRIAVGDEIVIPTPSADPVDGGEASPSP